MKLIYTPQGGERQEFAFRPMELLSIHFEPIEEAGGQVWDDFEGFCRALDAGKSRAKRAALWHCLRQARPEMTFAELVVGVGEINLYYEDDEIARAREYYLSDAAPADLREEFIARFGEGKDDAGGESTDSASPEPASAV